MPAITPSYLLSLLAMLAVSSLLVTSFMAYTNSLRSSSETNALKRLIGNVASECTELTSLASIGSQHSRTTIEMPTSLGDAAYWIRLNNDSDQAWVEGGLGDPIAGYNELRTFLPGDVSVIGTFMSGHASAVLECHVENDSLVLTLNAEGRST